MHEAGREINVSRLIDDQKLSWFLVRLLVLSSLILFFDGYDMLAVAFAAPRIGQEWNINAGSFSYIFGSTVIGMAIGSVLFGLVGDRYGRKPAIVAASIVFATFTLVVPLAKGFEALVALRLAAGIGLGGLWPNIIALLNEFAPTRYRATYVLIATLGFGVGIGVGGMIAAWLMPLYGWHVVFWIGGLAPLLLAVILGFWLPESLKFLVVKKRPLEEIARIVRQVDSTRRVESDTQFIASDDTIGYQPGKGVSSIKAIFSGDLAWITPLLWLASIACDGTVFFFNSWTPTLAQRMGISASSAALAITLMTAAASVTVIASMRAIDRFGVLWLAPMALATGLLMTVIGAVELSDRLFLGLMMAIGAAFGVWQLGLRAVVGIYYPADHRAAGVGWMLGISRIGSFVGSISGGLLIAADMPLPRIYLAMAVLPFISAACLLGIGVARKS